MPNPRGPFARCLGPVSVGCGVLGATLLLPWTEFGSRAQLGDIRHYRTFAEQILDGRVPYHDFFMEFPPGAIPIFLAPETAGHAIETYGQAFKWLVAIVTVAMLFAVAWTLAELGWSAVRTTAATALVAATPALLGPVYFQRYDVVVAAVTSFALLAMVKRRNATAALLIGVGAAAKVYPVLLLPLLLARSDQAGGRRAMLRLVLVSSAVFIAFVAPFAALAPGGVGYSFRTQLSRSLEIESLGGASLLSAHQLGWYHPFVHAGLSYELLGSLPKLVGSGQTILLLVVLVTTWLMFLRSSRSDEVLVLAAATTLVATVTLDKVISPQYLIWLAPQIVLLGGRIGVAARAMTVAAMLLTLAFFPNRFRDLRHLGSTAWIVLARDLVLVGLTVILLDALRRSVPSRSR